MLTQSSKESFWLKPMAPSTIPMVIKPSILEIVSVMRPIPVVGGLK